jgi:hypothetical protein
MLLAVKALVLVLVVSGVGATGASIGMVSTPMDKAIDIHERNLQQNSTLPVQSLKGQQTALDHLMHNQERWLAKHQGAAHGIGPSGADLQDAASGDNHGIGSNPFSMDY